MECAPVVVLPFARPDKLSRVLDQIRLAAPSVLYIGSDGPRDGMALDTQLVGEVRNLLDTAIDWPCEVTRIYRDQNYGCQGNTELTLDRVFSEVSAAIVLDDDCVPHPSFFRFCTELLEHYAPDDRIVHIAGCNEEVPPALFGSDSYAFTAFGSNWGWATWARAWHRHRADFPRPHDETTPRVVYGNPPNKFMPQAEPRRFSPARNDLCTRSGKRFFGDVASGRDLSLFEWGQQWRLSMLNHGGLAVTPAVNLIENVGFGPGSDSNMPTREMQPGMSIDFPLVHPNPVEINQQVQRVLERNLVRAVGRLARNVRRRTPAALKSTARKVGARLIR